MADANAHTPSELKNHFTACLGIRDLKIGKGPTVMLRTSDAGLGPKNVIMDYTLTDLACLLDPKTPRSPEYTESDIKLLETAIEKLVAATPDPDDKPDDEPAQKNDEPVASNGHTGSLLWNPAQQREQTPVQGKVQETSEIVTPTGIILPYELT